MSPLSVLTRLVILSTLATLTFAAAPAANVTITSVYGCGGQSGFSNATGCAPGMTLSIVGSNFHSLRFGSEQAVIAVGSTYWTCDDVVALPQLLTCTLPYVQMAGSAFMPVFIYNQSTGFEYTTRSVGVQYGLTLDLVGGCGWTSDDGIVYGCSQMGGSNITLQVSRIDQLPPDWELAVASANFTVKGSRCSTTAPSTIVCPLPYKPPTTSSGYVLPIWLQTSTKSALTSPAFGVVYAGTPTVASVTGCCFTDWENGNSYGCGVYSPMLTVTGSGFAQAWDGGAPLNSPIVVAGGDSGLAYQCIVSSYDEWSLVCAYLSPSIFYQDSAEVLQLSVQIDTFTSSNTWGVQFNTTSDACGDSSSGSSGGGDAGLAPQITWVGGSNCQGGYDGTTAICSTASLSLFTIIGSGFDAPSSGWLVSVSSSNQLSYYCGTNELTNTSVVCETLQPQLASQDDNSPLQVTLTTVYGDSNQWPVQISDDGPYVPVQPPSSSTAIAGMSFVTFIVVLTIGSVVLISVLLLIVLSCCCGVSVAALLCCRRAASSSSVNAPLLVVEPPAAAAAAAASSSYAVPSSRFGLSLPPNPHNYPAVPGRSRGY